ncbi:hypothetical protein V4F76_003280 [Salmonella enterica]|nr:hypothetical protein [Salmonella enterica]EHW0705362.1 hypothetical protein [Salmonella enterica]EKZ8774089.1 hypothetical protein [Salmonella enterica]
MAHDMIIIALCTIVGIPAIIGIMSFITWENGFRVLGAGYICRMTLVFIVLVWIIYLIPGGAK